MGSGLRKSAHGSGLAEMKRWIAIRFLGYLGVAVGAAVLFLAVSALADPPPGPQLAPLPHFRPHTHAAGQDWIMKGGHRNAAGEWCCGEGDCFEVEPVRVTANGYLIMATGELVPESEAMPSPDGKYWRCKRPDGTRRCFFAPPPSM